MYSPPSLHRSVMQGLRPSEICAGGRLHSPCVFLEDLDVFTYKPHASPIAPPSCCDGWASRTAGTTTSFTTTWTVTRPTNAGEKDSYTAAPRARCNEWSHLSLLDPHSLEGEGPQLSCCLCYNYGLYVNIFGGTSTHAHRRPWRLCQSQSSGV